MVKHNVCRKEKRNKHETSKDTLITINACRSKPFFFKKGNGMANNIDTDQTTEIQRARLINSKIIPSLLSPNVYPLLL